MGELLPLSAEDDHTLAGYRAAPQGKAARALQGAGHKGHWKKVSAASQTCRCTSIRPVTVSTATNEGATTWGRRNCPC